VSDDYFQKLSDDGLFGSTEGQLSVDVIESAHEILVRSAIAGVESEDLDIHVTSDTVTIRGTREHGCHTSESDTVHIQECYWGAFSRSVVLPAHVRPESADAVLKNGILTVRLKKAEMSSHLSPTSF